MARDIVAQADVLVKNFRPGVMEKLGFGYEDVCEYNPDIVYASASGYGSSGLYKNRPRQDLLIQALSGLTASTGRREDPPMTAVAFVADQLSALFIALHVEASFQRTCSSRSAALTSATNLSFEWRGGVTLAATLSQRGFGRPTIPLKGIETF